MEIRRLNASFSRWKAPPYRGSRTPLRKSQRTTDGLPPNRVGSTRTTAPSQATWTNAEKDHAHKNPPQPPYFLIRHMSVPLLSLRFLRDQNADQNRFVDPPITFLNCFLGCL